MLLVRVTTGVHSLIFNLVRVFGPLPMNLHNLPDNNLTPLSTVAEVYEQIVSDLNAAEACNLPAKYTEANRSIEGQNIYVFRSDSKGDFGSCLYGDGRLPFE